MDTEILEKIGLTKNESKVYISLLKIGVTTAQNLIKESELHASRVYSSLERLQSKGLVSSVVRDYKRYFQAAKPMKIVEYVDEQKERVKQIIPELERIENVKREEINASIYKGKEGLKTIHSEMLKEGKDVYVLGAKGLIYTELQYFIPNFEKERLKKRMKWICLWDKEKIGKEVRKTKLVEGKVLPKGYNSKAVVNIFGNKVAIVLWKEKYPTGFMIENKDVADSFRKWFEYIYKRLI